jgi:hypothetical protein
MTRLHILRTIRMLMEGHRQEVRGLLERPMRNHSTAQSLVCVLINGLTSGAMVIAAGNLLDALSIRVGILVVRCARKSCKTKY